MTIDSEATDSKLALRVEEIEKLIREGGAKQGFPLAALLETAQARLNEQRSEEVRTSEAKKEEEHKTQQNAIAAMVERETRLNAEEKERYEKLLQKDYFTKADFNDLDQFYSKSYDKLSSDGKAEMHQRIEEGIKRGEFSRDELPKSVREAQSNYKDVESGVTVKADRASKISGDVSASNGSVRGDSPDQVASIQYATDSNPEKLKQAAAKAKAAVPSDTLQGLELAFDDSIEPTKPAAAKTNGSSKETSI